LVSVRICPLSLEISAFLFSSSEGFFDRFLGIVFFFLMGISGLLDFPLKSVSHPLIIFYSCRPLHHLDELLAPVLQNKKPAHPSRKIVESGWRKMDHFPPALASLKPEA
jgi:hypothetical protein